MQTEVAAALIVVGGAVPALVFDVFSRRQSRFDEQMSHALDLLTGKTQRRSAGIAIVEGLLPRLLRTRSGQPRRSTTAQKDTRPSTRSRRRRAWYLATCGHVSNQIVYLLASSHSKDRIDELENLRRLTKLLVRLRAEGDALDRVVRVLKRRSELVSAAEAREDGLKPGSGLWLTADEIKSLGTSLLGDGWN